MAGCREGWGAIFARSKKKARVVPREGFLDGDPTRCELLWRPPRTHLRREIPPYPKDFRGFAPISARALNNEGSSSEGKTRHSFFEFLHLALVDEKPLKALCAMGGGATFRKRLRVFDCRTRSRRNEELGRLLRGCGRIFRQYQTASEELSLPEA